jgi:bifunctional non-homologous end joining protein LigD
MRDSSGGPGLDFPVGVMKATLGALPSGNGRWAYEVKWDGMRIVAFIGADGAVRLQSVNLRDVTASFPELDGLAAATDGRPAVLDGELVAYDDAGKPSFSKLQHRMHVTAPADVAKRAREVPVVYQVFDLLAFDGHDATPLPWRDRRRLLEQVVEPSRHWVVPATHDDGPALLNAVTELGLEGLVAKRRDSPYEVGRRSRAWVKVKVRREQELVVGGWAEGEGRRSGTLGALLVGYHEGGQLRYAGRVGTGFSDAELDRLAARLAPLARGGCPFDPLPPTLHRRRARWVAPELVVQVAYGEWTPEGLLRHPVYLGERVDKAASEVTREA